MRGALVRGAVLALLLATPGCGGRTTLEGADPNQAVTNGGSNTGNPGGGQGGLSPEASGGNSSGATSSGGGATATGGSSACRTTTLLSPDPSVLEFLVDSSLSMKTALTPELTRWSALQRALKQTFTTLGPSTLTGLTFYPNVQLSAGNHEGSSWCFLRFSAATIAPLDSEQRQRILDAVAAKLPLGATPTHDATLYALEQLKAASAPGRAHLVLLTDSAPTYGLNCSGSGMAPVDTTPLEGVVREALESGIDTFVIGLGGEDSALWMSRLAVAGGSARPGCAESEAPFCHYQVGSAADPVSALSNALLDVRARAASCLYELPNEAAARQLDSGSAELMLSTVSSSVPLLRQASRADCEFGFVHADPKSQTIELCPELCQAAQDRDVQIGLSLPCQASP